MLQNLYRSAERPYWHQGCWEGLREPQYRYETITATAYNSDGKAFQFGVKYCVEDESIVTVTGFQRLPNMSDLEYDIRESIRAYEHKSFTEINFDL